MSAPIRVAQVVGKMNGGGVEAVEMNYYRHIDKSRVQFDFLIDADSTLVPRQEIESLGGRVIVVPPYQHLGTHMRELERLFRTESWPIVHSHMTALSAFSLRAAKWAGVPVRIAHGHNTAGRGEHARNVLKAVLKTQVNRYPTHRFACSHAAGEWLFGKRASFEVISNAIDLARFRFNLAIRAGTRREFGVADGTFVVGHLGRFMVQKNHGFLLEAFALACKQRENLVLVLAGSGPLFEKTQLKARELGVSDKVRFLGMRSDSDRLFNAFDLFALPSLYEGLPLVSIEAQASGLSCLISNRVTHELDVTGRARYLPIASAAEWAEAIVAASTRCPSDEERASLCTADAASGALDGYDIVKAARELEANYIRMVERVESE